MWWEFSRAKAPLLEYGTLDVSMSCAEMLPEVSVIGMGVNPDLSAWPYTLSLT